MALDAPSLIKAADRIVVGDVLAVESAWDKAHTNIITTVSVAVRETLKGESAARLQIVLVGGTVDGVVMTVHGQASFAAGERAVLFLHGSAKNLNVVGLGQGKRPLTFDKPKRTWMVQPGDRSAAVTVDGQGHFQPAGDDVALSIDALRALVRAQPR